MEKLISADKLYNYLNLAIKATYEESPDTAQVYSFIKFLIRDGRFDPDMEVDVNGSDAD